jgi:hypothetical protein
MGAGDRTPKLLSRTLRLTAAVLVATCWLAAPAGASGLLPVQPAPVDPAAAATAAVSSAGATASGAVGAVTAARPVRTAIETVAATRPVSTVVETAAAVPPVRTAAETVAAVAAGARPAVRDTARRVRDSAGRAADQAGAGAPRPDGNGSKPAPALRDSGGKGDGMTAQAARLLTVQAEAAQLPASMPLDAPLAGLPAPAGAVALETSATASGSTAAITPSDDPSRPDPPSSPTGGGAAFAAGAGSLLMGGLAVLLATLSLAGPALRRRLPRLTVTAWPSAFVPLLERPG